MGHILLIAVRARAAALVLGYAGRVRDPASVMAAPAATEANTRRSAGKVARILYMHPDKACALGHGRKEIPHSDSKSFL
jgi:hypothetical protein